MVVKSYLCRKCRTTVERRPCPVCQKRNEHKSKAT